MTDEQLEKANELYQQILNLEGHQGVIDLFIDNYIRLVGRGVNVQFAVRTDAAHPYTPLITEFAQTDDFFNRYNTALQKKINSLKAEFKKL